jgi:predicted MPP superfamily phosphohydrolase
MTAQKDLLFWQNYGMIVIEKTRMKKDAYCMTKNDKRMRRWRILLGILIVCNIALIFLLSSQNAAKSVALSERITIMLVELFAKDAEKTTPTEPPTTNQGGGSADSTVPPEGTKPKDPMENLTEEEKTLVRENHATVRKFAHMLEFGLLGAFVFLLLLSRQGNILWRYAASLGVALACAVADELHQLFSNGRGAELSDVGLDLGGAAIACTLVLAFVVATRYGKRLVTTHYHLAALPNGKQLDIALVTDLHSCPHEDLVERLRAASPDIILLGGDIMENEELADESMPGYAFLRSCAAIAPTYYSLGNHETIGSNKKSTQFVLGVPEDVGTRIAKTGVTLLHNESVLADGVRICGLASGLSKKGNHPNEAVLAEFANAKEFRILLCHHPEYYEPYIRKTNIDLTVCGHAHGGQWRIFGRGVFAPGQGIFPKYTSGVIDNRCVISRGVGDHTVIPRIANPRELIIIHCGTKTKNQ